MLRIVINVSHFEKIYYLKLKMKTICDTFFKIEMNFKLCVNYVYYDFDFFIDFTICILRIKIMKIEKCLKICLCVICSILLLYVFIELYLYVMKIYQTFAYC